MANPVAVYLPDPAAQAARGGTGSAQIIQIDLRRSGKGARFAYADPAAIDAQFEDGPQAAGYAGSARTRAADAARRATRSGAATSDAYSSNESDFEVGRRRAPASVSFAAQQIAQEGLSPGLYFENFKPALAAYALAAQGAPQNGQSLEMSV